ncbi:MAG: DUF2029 domain-containing protein [Chloroflexi bacterium]|jgi:hypothetical protein|nr:DUF2029 domain-containing protein [Chloroflexota bacterium]
MSAQPSPVLERVKKQAARWQWVVVGLLVVLLAVDMARVWRITNHHDLDVFVLAAQRLVAGEDIFADAGPFQELIESGTFSMRDETVVWPYMYAPLIAMLFVPSLALPYPVVQALWWAFNLAALLGGTWLCLRATGRVSPTLVIVALVMLYRFDPAIVTLRLGQIELAQFLLLALTLYALSRGQEQWAGIALGLATGLKFFPGALIALLVWRRRWRAAAWAIGSALVFVVGSFAVMGLDALPRYMSYTAVYGLGGAFAAFPYNQSFNGFFSRNLIRNVFTATLKGVHLPGLARALTLAADGVVVLVSAALTWHRRGWPQEAAPEDQRRFRVEFALAVAALLLVLPHAQVYSFVWAMLPLTVLVAEMLAQPKTRWWQWALLVGSYLLMGRQYQLFRPGLTRFVQSHYLFGALLLWGTLALTLFRQRRADAAGAQAR